MNHFDQEYTRQDDKITFQKTSKIDVHPCMENDEACWYRAFLNGKKTPFIVQTPSSESDFALYKNVPHLSPEHNLVCVANEEDDGFLTIITEIVKLGRSKIVKTWMDNQGGNIPPITVRTINIAKDYTEYLGGRTSDDGPGNGTDFRKKFLVPALQENIKLHIILNGVAGYPSSFWDSAFVGLLYEDKIPLYHILNSITFIADDEFQDFIQTFIQAMIECDAKMRECQYDDNYYVQLEKIHPEAYKLLMDIRKKEGI